MMKTKLIIVILAIGIVGAVIFFYARPKAKALDVPFPQAISEKIQKEGELRLRQKMYAPLIATYKKMLEKMPENIEVKKKLAFAYFGAGQYENAKPLLEEVVKAYPDDGEVKKELEFIKNLK